MFGITDILDIPPYSLSKQQKSETHIRALTELTRFHYERCNEYHKILDAIGYDISKEISSTEELPFLPVRLFKEYDLLSVDRANIIKTMTSSGTTGQRVSKIFLDRDTSTNQTKVLTKITSTFLGPKRLPMLIIDTSTVLKDRYTFSARGSGILGFSMLGYDATYALDEHMNINYDAVEVFLRKHENEDILLFGFTFMIWEHFYGAMVRDGRRLPLDRGILIHGGGWKKLLDRAVDNETFKSSLREACGISRVYNYYGMVEQTGSIYMECERGHLHAPIFSDIIIRDHMSFRPLGKGQVGHVQLLSLLPLSYPGHSLLSEDLGELLGEDDCPCCRQGKYFKIHGRVKNAEIRGCSDTYDRS